MRIGMATDHGGEGVQEALLICLRAAGHEAVDVGAHRLNPSDDSPDCVIPRARAVATGEVERGAALCGSGVGAAVCATKVPGICAALMHVRGAEAAMLLLDELASEPLTAARGELCATTLHSYDAAVPPIAGIRELLLKRQDALIRRVDSGVAVSVRLVYILQDLRTPEAKAALRRAAASSPVPQVRSQAKAWLEWNDR